MRESLAKEFAKTMPTIVTLPIPPSVNALWRTWRGRVHRSKTYAAWREAAGWELAIQRPARIPGPVTVTIAAGRPDRRKRDVDNLPKAILDLLQAHQVIADDSQVMKITTGWDSTVPAGTVRVTVESAMVMMAYAKG
jgi:crossover junction endodeoxyribonuclease RusA